MATRKFIFFLFVSFGPSTSLLFADEGACGNLDNCLNTCYQDCPTVTPGSGGTDSSGATTVTGEGQFEILSAKGAADTLQSLTDEQGCRALSRKHRRFLRRDLRKLIRQNWSLIEKYGLASDTEIIRSTLIEARKFLKTCGK